MGIATLVEFLQKKGHVVENNPNAKITEEEYEMLVKEFSQDMTLKKEAERLVQERMNREKHKAVLETPVKEEEQFDQPEEKKMASKEENVIHIEDEIIDLKPKIKQVGKKDIDALTHKTVKGTDQLEKQVAPVESPVEVEEKPKDRADQPSMEASKEVEPSRSETIPVVETVPVAEVQVEKEEKQVQEEVLSVESVQEKEASAASVEEVDSAPSFEEKLPVAEMMPGQEPEIFTLGDRRIESTIKVIKTIDLDAINQSTRPRKKTQAEKKKEREENCSRNERPG